MTGPVGLSLLQAKDKLQTPSKNKTRLSAPSLYTDNTQVVLADEMGNYKLNSKIFVRLAFVLNY